MRSRVRRQCYYDARVNDINLEDITSSENNANILRALRDEEPDNCCDEIYLLTGSEIDDVISCEFVVREGDDLGWLGYFIGESKYLEWLVIMSLPDPENREGIDELIEGIARNRSIQNLHAASNFWDHGLESLGQFIGENKSISEIGFSNMDIGRKRARSIASVLVQMMQLNPMKKHKSMKSFAFFNNNIVIDEGFAVICGELRSHPQLEQLYLYDNDNIGRNECATLGNMLSSWHAPNLNVLDLRDNSIGDRGLQALVEGMVNCCNLEKIRLSGNRSITAAGLRSLSTLFQSRSCSLKEIWLEGMNIGDDGATALAEGLVGNKSLKRLYFDVNVAGITEVGWSAFSKLLCDTSSINNTYLSNHTLEWIGEGDDLGAPEDVAEHLDWTTYTDINEHDVATWKILKHHHELDIESLLQWKLKLLPLLVTWFESKGSLVLPENLALADHITMNMNSDGEDLFGIMKLSAVYKYVRGVPLSIIDGYNSRRTSTRLARKRRLNGEIK